MSKKICIWGMSIITISVLILAGCSLGNAHETPYGIFVDDNMQKSERAVLMNLDDETLREYTLSEKDTKKLRELLDEKSGWVDNDFCECIGSYELLLDNISYVIDLTDLKHQIKYGEIDSDLKGAIENENTTVVSEVYEILEKAMQE